MPSEKGAIILFKRFFISLSLIVLLFCSPLSQIAYASSADDWSSWENCFGTPYDNTVLGGYQNTSPTDFPSIPDKPYVFCFGTGWAGKAIYTDSTNLICTGSANHQSCSFSVPSGFHLSVYEYSIQGNYPNATGTNWYNRGTASANVAVVSHGITYGSQIWQQDVTIVDTDGTDISEPIVDENFEFELSAWTDYSVRGYASTNTENIYRVQFFVCPEPDPSASVDLIADGIFDFLSQLSDSTLSESDSERIKHAFQAQYPLIYEALEIGTEKIVKVAEAIQHLAIGVTIPSSPISGGLDYAVDLINQVRFITDSSYYGYRGFGGGYIGSTGSDFTINVLNFYSNVRNSPSYTDVNRVYAVFYSNTESEYPVAVLSSTFCVSDFFPSMTFPPLSVPSPSVIDGQSSTPNGSGTDWTIFQHAMYMQYLLDQLNRDFSISLKNYGDSLKLPDNGFVYNADDLTPFEFDESLPDVDTPDGLLPDLARPVSLLGKMWTDTLSSLGIGTLVIFMMSLGLVSWFFYGKKR